MIKWGSVPLLHLSLKIIEISRLFQLMEIRRNLYLIKIRKNQKDLKNYSIRNKKCIRMNKKNGEKINLKTRINSINRWENENSWALKANKYGKIAVAEEAEVQMPEKEVKWAVHQLVNFLRYQKIETKTTFKCLMIRVRKVDKAQNTMISLTETSIIFKNVKEGEITQMLNV